MRKTQWRRDIRHFDPLAKTRETALKLIAAKSHQFGFFGGIGLRSY
jgi:hypothetical protein